MGGWGTSILLLDPPHDNYRGWWNMLSSLDLGSHQCLSQFVEKEEEQMTNVLYSEVSSMSKNITSGQCRVLGAIF